ncbi:MAG: hypothetical protein ACMUIE_03180 [Thermoplasmatota archaeon]
MDDALEFTAIVDKKGGKYQATCPEIGLSLRSSDQKKALEILHRWTKSIVDPLVVKDNVNT